MPLDVRVRTAARAMQPLYANTFKDDMPGVHGGRWARLFAALSHDLCHAIVFGRDPTVDPDAASLDDLIDDDFRYGYPADGVDGRDSYLRDLAELRGVAVWFAVLRTYGVRFDAKIVVRDIAEGLYWMTWEPDRAYTKVVALERQAVVARRAARVVTWIEKLVAEEGRRNAEYKLREARGG